jgi:UDP-N-acetylmuramoyl-tripeptide--D-alanyl-D-alanine ligase
MTLIAGIKNSSIIDDTYNASPVSTLAALEVFGEIKSKRKIAVLGDMLELGEDSPKNHLEMVKKALKVSNVILFAVGKRMLQAASELKQGEMENGNILSFQSPMEAGRKLQEIMEEGDLILVKGSQGMRMEKVVEEVMAEPERAEELLCRQNSAWREKPWQEV